VHGEDRDRALGRMLEALAGFEIAGVTTNLAFLAALLSHPQVTRGEIDTGFIERELSALTRRLPLAAIDMAAACAAVLAREGKQQISASGDPASPWSRIDGWMLAGRRSRRMSFRHGSGRLDAMLWYDRDGMTMEFAGVHAPLRFRAGTGD